MARGPSLTESTRLGCGLQGRVVELYCVVAVHKSSALGASTTESVHLGRLAPVASAFRSSMHPGRCTRDLLSQGRPRSHGSLIHKCGSCASACSPRPDASKYFTFSVVYTGSELPSTSVCNCVTVSLPLIVSSAPRSPFLIFSSLALFVPLNSSACPTIILRLNASPSLPDIDA